MEFLDRTGHIFSINSYSSYPVGYEYQESDYIFWFNSEISGKLSVDNYYFKPIRVMYKISNNESVSVEINLKDSDKFYLIGSKFINEKLLSSNIDTDINDRISINESDILSSKSLKYSCILQYSNEGISMIETGDLNGCIVEESSVKKYRQTFYTLESGIEFDGTNIREVDGRLVGDIDINGVIQTVPLEESYRMVEINDEDITYLTEEEKESIEEEKETYLIIPFYVLVNSPDYGTWETNVLINFNDNDYCPITVGAEIVDECEELIINGINYGVKLPKEIIRAIYSSDYSRSVPDERLYASKLKEYLLNFMQIKGQVGNFKSIINGLDWFEWGDKLSISKLYKTDNYIQKQYLIDYFDLINDNIYSYQLFKTTSYIVIKFSLTEDGKQEKQNLISAFWGEAKPSIIHRLNDIKTVSYDEGDINYYKGYFNYTFSELGLKLCALKYYYEKYFLPIHLKVHNLYMDEHVYANDIKLISKVSHSITENPIYINQFNYSDSDITKELRVDFNTNGFDTIFLNRVKEYVDGEYNVFTDTYQKALDDKIDAYYIDDVAVRIPIDIYNFVYTSSGETYNDSNSNTYYDVYIYLSKYVNPNIDSTSIEINGQTYSNINQIHSTHFSFIQNKNNKYKGLIIHPKTINNERKFDVNFWIDGKFRIDAIINGQIFEYVFKVKLPELNIQVGKLEYKYDTLFSQVEKIDESGVLFNTFMYQPDLVTMNNIDFIEDIYFKEDIADYIKRYYTQKINTVSDGYLNRCHLIDILDTNKNPIPYNGKFKPSLFNEVDLGSLELFSSNDCDSSVISLYREFFTDEGECKLPKDMLYVNGNEYDFYLMHDYERWYGVMISKLTVDLHTKKDSKFTFHNKKLSYKFGNYILKYVRSDSKILINRFNYIPSYGINHFLKSDLLVVSLYNNDKLQFKPSLGSKWTITPLSIGMASYDTVESNSELAVISVGNKNSSYERGYYSVSVEYCVDDFIQHSYKKSGKFRIDEDEELIDTEELKNYYKAIIEDNDTPSTPDTPVIPDPPIEPVNPNKKYFSMTFTQAGNLYFAFGNSNTESIFISRGQNIPTIEYMINDSGIWRSASPSWSEVYSNKFGKNIHIGTLICSGEVGDVVKFRGNNDYMGTMGYYTHFITDDWSETGTRVIVGGNTMSLLYGDDFEDKTTLPSNFTFLSLLSNNDADTIHGGLSYFINTDETSLGLLPAIRATTCCYQSMFEGCSTLSVLPSLPATTLAWSCYYCMFEDCSLNLTTIPEGYLPAMNLVYNCYGLMFNGCNNLTSVMSILPAIDIADDCYLCMFEGTGISTAPILPATDLNACDGCYCRMFKDCVNLLDAPSLPATTLCIGCYDQMFDGCTSLRTTPVLPAQELMQRSYQRMFSGCTSINRIEVYATDISALNCTNEWLADASEYGSFVNRGGANFETNSVSGIPYGWTVNS